MNVPPAHETFTRREWNLIQRLKRPANVQRWLTSLPYNWEHNRGTMRSFREVVRLNEAQCLEAAVAAAVILEQYGYPPLLLALESRDLPDYVIFVSQIDGVSGAIGRCRVIG